LENINTATESQMDGMPKVVPIAPGEAHLQNILQERKCYICHKDFTDDMVIMRVAEKQMGFVCPDHEGVIQEFLRQFKMVPLGWVQTVPKE
jgi:hypothetical protein